MSVFLFLFILEKKRRYITTHSKGGDYVPCIIIGVILYGAWKTVPGEPWSLHHRLPRFWGGEIRWPYQNGVRIPDRIHRDWHTLFHSWPPEWIIDDINAKYVDLGSEFILVLFSRDRIEESPNHRRLRERLTPRHDIWRRIFPRHFSLEDVADALSNMFDSHCRVFTRTVASPYVLTKEGAVAAG